VEHDHYQRRQDIVHSVKVKAGKRRTYFFDVRRTRGDDFFLTLTESTRRMSDGSFERHKIFLYKEDFNRFLAGLEDVVAYIKTELMPNYDYDEFSRRHDEFEGDLEYDEDYPREQGPPDAGPKPGSAEDLTW